MSHSDPDSVPPFKSTLPPELLKGQDDRGLYLYTKLDEIGQAQKWLLEKAVEHGRTLDAVVIQTTKTNGTLKRHDIEIKALEEDRGLKLARVGAGLVRSKIFWGATLIFALVVMPWVTVHAAAVLEMVKSVVSIFAT